MKNLTSYRTQKEGCVIIFWGVTTLSCLLIGLYPGHVNAVVNFNWQSSITVDDTSAVVT